MKKLILSILVLLVFSVSASASDDLNCSTAKDSFGGYENIVVSPQDLYTATIRGAFHGGMSHTIRLIGPISVQVSYQGGEILFSNSEQGVQLDVNHASAQFKDGQNPVVSMTCQIPDL